MMRGRRTVAPARAVAAAVVVTLVSALVSTATPAASAADDPVTLPEIEAINPKVTAYEVTVSDAGGAGTLVARWAVGDHRFAEVALPHEGTVALPLADTITENVRTSVEVYRCAGATWTDAECVWVDGTDWLDVYIEASMELDVREAIGTAPRPFAWRYIPAGLGTTQWRLLAADGSVLQSGTTGPGAGAELALSVPAGTPAQRGSIELVMSVDGTAVGHLDGRVVIGLDLDGTAPRVPALTLSGTQVYPYRDDYLDAIRLTVAAEPWTQVDVFVVDASGAARLLDTDISVRETARFVFDGTDEGSYRFPPGTYSLRVVSEDASGNTTTAQTGPITVSNERLEQRTWRRTVTATRSVIRRDVGPCGALRRPASRRWRGSLSYVSGTTCRDPKKAYVHAVHALRVPASFQRRYSSVRVSLMGGPSLGAPRGSYLVIGYYRAARRWKFDHRHAFVDRGVRTRDGAAVYGAEAERLVHDSDDRPFVAWSTGLTSGSRYDVRTFTVTIGYQRLVAPRGRRT